MSFEDDLRAALDDGEPTVDAGTAWSEHLRRVATPVGRRRGWGRPLIAAASVVVVGAAAVTVALTVRSADPDPAPAAPPAVPSTAEAAPLPSSTGPQVDPSTTAMTKGDILAYPMGEQRPCDGVAPESPAYRLTADADVVSAVVCRTGKEVHDGDGVWQTEVVQELPPESLDTLLRVLRTPDIRGDENMPCTADLRVPLGFVLTLADGSRIRPGVPSDGCHPMAVALQVLEEGGTEVSSAPDRRAIPQVVLDTGCHTTGGSPLAAGPPRDQTWPVIPTGTILSVCRYGVGTVDRSAELVAVGSIASDDLIAQWPTASAASPAGCGFAAQPAWRPILDTYGSAGSDWVVVTVQPADEPFRPDLDLDQRWSIVVDLGSCGWVTSAHQAVGHLGPDLAADLAARADRPVSPDEVAQPGPTSADDPLVTCGGDPFRVSAMGGAGVQYVDLDEIASVLDDLSAENPLDAPLRGVPAAEAAWFVLSLDHSDGSIQVAYGEWSTATGPMGPDSGVVGLEPAADGLKATGWGPCNLTPALPDDAAWARIMSFDTDPDSTVVTLGVTEVDCTGARDPAEFLHEPMVQERADTVIITFTTTPIQGAATCPGNPTVRRTVELSEPLGDRTVLDGSVWPPEPVR